MIDNHVVCNHALVLVVLLSRVQCMNKNRVTASAECEQKERGERDDRERERDRDRERDREQELKTIRDDAETLIYEIIFRLYFN